MTTTMDIDTRHAEYLLRLVQRDQRERAERLAAPSAFGIRETQIAAELAAAFELMANTAPRTVRLVHRRVGG